MSDCNCVILTKLEGSIDGPKDYYCKACGQQYRVEKLVIEVNYDKPPDTAKG